jgi:hypothetical protein
MCLIVWLKAPNNMQERLEFKGTCLQVKINFSGFYAVKLCNLVSWLKRITILSLKMEV